MKFYNIIFNSCKILPLYASTVVELSKSPVKQIRFCFCPAVNRAEVDILGRRHLLVPVLPFLGVNAQV